MAQNMLSYFMLTAVEVMSCHVVGLGPLGENSVTRSTLLAPTPTVGPTEWEVYTAAAVTGIECFILCNKRRTKER